MNNAEIGKAMVIKLDPVLPEYPTFKEGVRRAPKRELTLNKREIKLAVANALRYVPEELHEQLAPEFLDELFDKRPYLRLSLYAEGKDLRKTY